jgi:hypothetical protein
VTTPRTDETFANTTKLEIESVALTIAESALQACGDKFDALARECAVEIADAVADDKEWATQTLNRYEDFRALAGRARHGRQTLRDQRTQRWLRRPL